MENQEFGKKLIEVRKARGLTQEEVAERSKITARTIQRIESGIVKPRAFTIKRISETLGFDFFNSRLSGYNSKEEQSQKLKKHTVYWHLKDLFNLKTNAMKKISILSTTTLAIALSLVIFNPDIFAQTAGEKKNSISIEKKADNSIKRIEVRFTNTLTYDSLVFIKSALEKYDIKINYKIIEFDDNNHLKRISCEAFTSIGSGSFYVLSLDSLNIGGFFCDYSDKAKPNFCIGGGCFKSTQIPH